MIKAQCKCGHKVAVPDDYAGKRVKCVRCGGAIAVPRGEEELVATLVDDSAVVGMPAPEERPRPRDHSPHSRRHRYEHRQQARSKQVAVVVSCLFAVVLIVVIIVLANYGGGSDPTPIAGNTQGKGKNPPLFDDPSIRPRKNTPIVKRTNDDEERMAGKDGGADDTGEGGDTVTVAGQQFTGKGDVLPVQTTSSFDATTNLTTIRSKPTKLTVGERSLEMTIEAKHEGQKREAGGHLEARLRIKGDMRGLISGANTDEPVMLIGLDGRDPVQLSPIAKAEGDDRKDENGPVVLPAWVEYGLDGSTLTAIRKANEMRVALGDEEVTFSPDQVKLLQMLGE